MRHRRLSGVLAAALVLSALPAGAQTARRYTVDRWTVEDGLPNNALTHLLHTSDGYLWIGTWAGAVRFDGVRFTHAAADLPNDHVRALLEDRQGAMWIGLSGAGVVRLRPGGYDSFTTANGLPGQDVRALAEDAAGRIWVGTEAGVGVIDGARVTAHRIDGGARANLVSALTRSHDGRIRIATATGVCESRDVELRCTAVDDRLGEPRAVLHDRSGRLWIGTSRGVFRDEAAVTAGAVTALFEARDGTVWIGFANGELAALGGGGDERYRIADGLPPGGPVVTLAEDAEGSIWIGTLNGGFSRLRPKRVRMYSTADGLPAAVVASIVQDAAGTIWAGTHCGPASALRGEQFVPRFVEHTGNACVSVLWPARDGSLWIGTRDAGLFRWADGRMRHFDRDDGLSDAHVSALFEDRDGVIWIGTELGGLHTYANGRLSRAYRDADGVATHLIASFAQDRDGRVWIGSNGNGLSIYERGGFRILAPSESPPTRDIAALLVDSRGDLWIGSAADGLFRRRNGRYEPFGDAQGLGDRLIALVVEDRDANVWVGTARGIVRLERARIEAVAAGRAASLEPIILDRADGLLNAETSGGGFDPSGLVDRAGRIWISTIDGIAVIEPRLFRRNDVRPRLRIEGVTLDERPVVLPDDGAIEVPAGTPSIDIAYTAFSMLAPSKVRFRYRLEGHDTNWRDVGGRRTAYYTRLPPGRYEFQVMAANNDGLWSTAPAVLRLNVLPFVWERRGVQAATVAALLAATGVSVLVVVQRRARRRLADLERERALEHERTRIARDLHDDLGSRLTYIAMIAETPGLAEGVPRSARDAVETLDELVWTVNARNDTVNGFASYASHFAEEHLAAAGLRFRLHLGDGLERHGLAADERRHLYLAFKEAINNVVKHARASEVHVGIVVTGATLRVTVADNGRGFQGPGDPTGNGLTNMRERLGTVGGSVAFESPEGTGGRVVIEMPLTPGARPGPRPHLHVMAPAPAGVDSDREH